MTLPPMSSLENIHSEAIVNLNSIEYGSMTSLTLTRADTLRDTSLTALLNDDSPSAGWE
eukprot:m.291116 g.291116  ORF g.291116 m.291116 type:complete len:59 (-) comp201157_c0_seq1:106-282(-)